MTWLEDDNSSFGFSFDVDPICAGVIFRLEGIAGLSSVFSAVTRVIPAAGGFTSPISCSVDFGFSLSERILLSVVGALSGGELSDLDAAAGLGRATAVGSEE